ncbi:hypothetical protein KW787_01090 [Candidatus Pacearchaeota archaeon]|nr:hypothetical protein [Candidatus Pacearchaeota archaeon]
MSSSEYVRISVSEKFYGQKNLLHAQLELLNNIKHLKEYIRLRKEELVLRVSLKNKLDDAIVSLEALSKILPKGNFVTHNQKIREDMITDKDVITIEEELDEIKKKLSRLQA